MVPSVAQAGLELLIFLPLSPSAAWSCSLLSATKDKNNHDSGKKDLKLQNILNTINSYFSFNFLISVGQDWGSCYRFLSGGRSVVPQLYQILTGETDEAQSYF